MWRFQMRDIHQGALAVLASALLLCAAMPAASTLTRAAEAQTGEAKAVVYSCPMHPEVRSKKKGRCPVCGRDLRPTRAAQWPPEDPTKTSASGGGSTTTPSTTAEGTREAHAA